jgi:hypothetical protein
LKDFVVKDSNQGQHNTTAPSAQVPRADKVKIVACDGKSMFSIIDEFISSIYCYLDVGQP